MVIWKYPLHVTDRQTLMLPLGARILAVQAQHNAPCLWAMVDPTVSAERRTFVTCGTGNAFEYEHYDCIGTYQLNAGALVFHVFEVSA